VIIGLGILENAYSQTCKFAAMKPSEIDTMEPELLKEARTHLPLIPFDSTDVLIVDRIGKDISGDGMDPNIVGAGPCSPYVKGGISTNRIVILDLTPETHGVALGIGAAHAITKRLFDQIDFDATYVNAITSRGIDYVRVPAITANDREAIRLALRTCIGHDTAKPKIIRISDSLHTETFYVSEALEADAKKKGLEILEGPKEWNFDSDGNLW